MYDSLTLAGFYLFETSPPAIIGATYHVHVHVTKLALSYVQWDVVLPR